ncbi:MAG: hypothetical protein ETSY2_18160 [Candidatus Entotheonella gemina]|uniref:Uncharacterized protein n=1 Tax=Candidatus Entotheonella gemina TaxID=1429439 RepID=W4M9G3_9BACT|nr:MAG: hypothetical protein ETSY2_18160 [Candidatus Entotheonella gemina]
MVLALIHTTTGHAKLLKQGWLPFGHDEPSIKVIAFQPGSNLRGRVHLAQL